MKLSDRLSRSHGTPATPGQNPAASEAPAEPQASSSASPPAVPPALLSVPGTAVGPAITPAVDALAGLKQRAAQALFERMGTRFSDSASTEEALRASAVEELSTVIDQEQVPLSPEERRRLIR